MYKRIDNQLLACEDVVLKDIVNIYKTPFYVYSKSAIVERVNILKKVFSPIKKDVLFAYSVKAESNISILKTIIDNGFGADIVSIYEAYRFITAGGNPKKIVFSGVGKTDYEIEEAINLGVKQFNIESIEEAKNINNIANRLNKTVDAAIRINPNIDAHTHVKITTGTKSDKFGISIQTVKNNADTIKNLKNINIKSIAMHIGSQMIDAYPFCETILELKSIVSEMKSLGFNIETVDIGGGYGVRYEPHSSIFDFRTFEEVAIPILAEMNVNIITEPGRFIIANAGALIMKVVYLKNEADRVYAVLDGGMNAYIRVAMYEAYNTIEPLEKKQGKTTIDFVGPICESSDVFARDRILYSNIEEGDYVALMDAGAYGASMSSNYNSHLLPAQVLIDKDKHYLIRKEQTFEHLIANEILVS